MFGYPVVPLHHVQTRITWFNETIEYPNINYWFNGTIGYPNMNYLV
jgi:hypothetical protein